MQNPFLEKVECLLASLDFEKPKLLSQTYEPEVFGNAEVVYELSNLVLCFTRDRGQEFLDLASRCASDKKYLFSDVALVMEWETLEDVISASEPVPLVEVLQAIARDYKRLDKMFSAKELFKTKAKISQARSARVKLMFQK